MTTFAELIQRVSEDLNDYSESGKYVRWSQAQLEAYIKEGVILASNYTPSSFSKVTVVKLSPGSDQEVCECMSIGQVLGQTDEFGNMLGGPLPKISTDINSRWFKVSCSPQSSYFKLTGYSKPSVISPSFTVDPSVPPGVDVYVKLECIEKPEVIFEEGGVIPESIIPPVIQWALYRALSVDEQSPDARAAAQDHANRSISLFRMMFSRSFAMGTGLVRTPEVDDALNILRASGLIGGQV